MKAEKELNALIAAKARYEQSKKVHTVRWVTDADYGLDCVPHDAATTEFIEAELSKIIRALQDKAEIDLDAAEAAYAAALAGSAGSTDE